MYNMERYCTCPHCIENRIGRDAAVLVRIVLKTRIGRDAAVLVQYGFSMQYLEIIT